SQRPAHRVPAIRASAQSIPLRDQSVDAAMTVLSLHHWDDGRAAGLQEMRRITRGPIIILTCDAAVSGQMWLMADYFPEIRELDFATFPTMDEIAGWLGGRTEVEVLPI